MAFVIPTFNLPVSVFNNGTYPAGPPRLSIMGTLTPGDRSMPLFFPGAVVGSPGMFCWVPAGTDVRDTSSAAGPDVVEIPAGTGRAYDVVRVDDVAKGNANEYRFCVIVKAAGVIWPTPIP